MLAPFAINGLAVREAFFINFMTRLDVDADAARRRLSLLRRDSRARAPRRGDPRLGGDSARRAASCLDASLRWS
jgi:hypothetical protein